MKRKKEPRELTKEEVKIVVAVKHCSRELGDFLQGARLRSQNDLALFARSDITSLFRALESYSDMYYKLEIENRQQLYALFSKSKDANEIQDTQDAIEEIEGLWNNFLSNLEVDLKSKLIKSPNTVDEFNKLKLGSVINLQPIILRDILMKKDVRLHDLIHNFDSALVVMQPAYMPDTPVRHRYFEVKKLKDDLKHYKVQFVVVTWGEEDDVRDWCRALRRMVDFPILWDKDLCLLKRISPKNGLDKIWSWQSLEFCGMNKVKHNWPINPPPNEMNWLDWKWVGAEFMLSKETIEYEKVVKTRKIVLREKTAGSSRSVQKQPIVEDGSSSSDDEKIEKVNVGPKLPLPIYSWNVVLMHRARNLGDVAAMGTIYQAIMSCSASRNKVEENIMIDKIRQERKLCTAPDTSRMERERESGLLYDPITELHFDEKSGYHWNARERVYYVWSEQESRYIRADSLIKMDHAQKNMAMYKEKCEELKRSIKENTAAREAATKVSAQLAALRANKDHYAAYAYSTCIAPQNIFNEDELFQDATQHACNFQSNMNTTLLNSNKPSNSRTSQPAPLVTLQPEYEEDAPPPGL